MNNMKKDIENQEVKGEIEINLPQEERTLSNEIVSKSGEQLLTFLQNH